MAILSLSKNFITPKMLNIILFDLDQTLLDRNTSLIKFVEWQVNFFQLVSQENNFYALGLKDFFSTIIVSEAVGMRKPDRQIFEYACKELGCTPNECIFVGDNHKADIEGANNAGMKTIFFHPDPSICSTVADKKIHHYDQLETAINTLEDFIL